jgi:DNA-binding transcriptional regulator YdaS (Cro superfamily)
MKIRKHLERAIALLGSESRLGKAAGYSQNAIWHAKKRGSVTPQMAKAIEQATGGAVGRHELCPDVFDPPNVAA